MATGGAGEERVTADPIGVVAHADPGLFAQLERLAASRMVFFAGLPGTGKSLLTHQLAHLAHARGRTVHLLQWDVARPAIEASEAGRRYPVRDGISHAVVRVAAGLWAREAIARWAARTGPGDVLIGETPFVGHRFIELARRADDAAEPHLSAPSCRFVVPVPSREVRAHLEAERERRAAQPLHAREAEDAPPQVLRGLWGAVIEAAQALGLAAGGGTGAPVDPAAGSPAYDPATYRVVYQAVLVHRHYEIVPLDVILPTGALSVYAFAIPCVEVVPTPEEAARAVGQVETRFRGAATLDATVARWWEV
ncbi:MAG: hypothetical protein QN147_03675 [Armatimonadota bacterium]|nr:hypothetical protein [Armatimonadota bacterium]MDR7511110.1 hypothetical protein [Armatimonadota bacterium]